MRAAFAERRSLREIRIGIEELGGVPSELVDLPRVGKRQLGWIPRQALAEPEL